MITLLKFLVWLLRIAVFVGLFGLAIKNNPIDTTPPEKRTPGFNKMISEVVQLKHLEIDEIQPVIQELMNPFAKIQPIARMNGFLITDTSANIERAVDFINHLDVPVEVREEVRVYELTDGPLKLVESNYVIPPHANVLRTAEDMQRHFVWVIKGFEAPKGEVYMAIEQSKGELGYYIYSDGSNTPYRLRLRTPDFVNLQVLPYMAQGAMLADMVALIGTIDIVLGSVDR